MSNDSTGFVNKDCEYFPCHRGIDEDDFSCLFCFCPLYALGEGCGGDFVYLHNGIKDCSACTFPHKRSSYPIMIDRLGDVIEMVRK